MAGGRALLPGRPRVDLDFRWITLEAIDEDDFERLREARRLR
jgi:hypothetical protein